MFSRGLEVELEQALLERVELRGDRRARELPRGLPRHLPRAEAVGLDRRRELVESVTELREIGRILRGDIVRRLGDARCGRGRGSCARGVVAQRINQRRIEIAQRDLSR